MAELKDSCVKPARGPIMDQPAQGDIKQSSNSEVKKVSVRVGSAAPDFEANAFIEGKGFAPVKLSDYKGQWVVACFYPGDFTFV